MPPIIAQAELPPSPWPTLIGLLIPWMFLGLIMGSILAVIAPRKGASAALWFFVGFIPAVGMYAAYVLVSRPDIAVLERIRKLEDLLKSQNGSSV